MEPVPEPASHDQLPDWEVACRRALSEADAEFAVQLLRGPGEKDLSKILLFLQDGLEAREGHEADHWNSLIHEFSGRLLEDFGTGMRPDAARLVQEMRSRAAADMLREKNMERFRRRKSLPPVSADGPDTY
ncbi:MAG: hypothetical protein M3N59_00855 [bacterium]|nr:hypothetical protein [bacterium]